MRLINREQLLYGKPVVMSDNSCIVYPIKLKEIFDVGSDKFFKYLTLLTLSDEEIKKLVKHKEAKAYDFIVQNSLTKDDFKKEVCEAFSFFIKEDITFYSSVGIFLIGEIEGDSFRAINFENFCEFQDILKQQNFLMQDNKKQTKSASKIRERLNKAKEKINKKKGSSDVEFVDLVASLPLSEIGVNILNAWELTYYMFNDQFKRSRKKDEFETAMNSIFAGASPKKIKVKDWIYNIQSNNDE